MTDLKTSVLNVVPGVMSLAVLKNADKVLKNPTPKNMMKGFTNSLVGISLTNATSKSL